ncbi:MAG: hypothetical protein FJ096_15390 [Deltaproteobacteria bacterium]|nr:hypothetical protein [Deltaproteobacteria bacterium]
MSEPKPSKKKKASASQSREELLSQQRQRLEQVPDPLAPENLKKVGLRIGIGAVVVWGVAAAINHWIAFAVAGVVTVLVIGVLAWAWRFTTRTKAVTEILKSADTEEGRKQAMDRLKTEFKEGDPAATFAKAQLQLQDDPRAALVTLETIKLDRVMASVADEARSQRAMIHLILGETDKARPLADGIDLSRHKEARVRATMASVIGEAWARSGQSKRAVELLETFDLEDAEYQDLKPQILRSLAFAYAWADQMSKMRATLRQLEKLNVQILMGFITKKKHPGGVNPKGVHPALEQEALKLVQKSAGIQRQMQFRRM